MAINQIPVSEATYTNFHKVVFKWNTGEQRHPLSIQFMHFMQQMHLGFCECNKLYQILTKRHTSVT